MRKTLLQSLLLVGAIGMTERAASEDSATLHMTARQRLVEPGGGTTVSEKTLDWPAKKTAVVVCDMWDHHWCQGASRRVAEMAPRMNRVIAEARKQGVLIVHAPSSCMEAYRETPQRKLATEAPLAADLPREIEGWCRALPGEPPLPIDDSDGGCDDQPQCAQGSPWKRQIDTIEIAQGDAVTDQGRELWNLLAQRGIENVIVMGVHANMCVAGRPFALRQMVKNKKNVVLARDLTDSMYNSRKAPFVSHQRGTGLVIEHIEAHICPTVDSSDISGAPRPAHAVFMIGEDEYNTKVTLPAFAKAQLEPLGIRCTFVHESPSSPGDFSGIEALQEADLLVISVRRRAPPTAQLATVRDYLESGKPLVGIRTASHAFGKEGTEGRSGWQDFDSVVLGAHYAGHYGTQPPEGGPSLVHVVESAARLPLTLGLPEGELKFASHLYKYPEFSRSCVLLLEGHVEGRAEREPVAWTHTYKGARIFYTSLGSPADFEAPPFKTLLRNAVLWTLDKPLTPTAAAASQAGGKG